MPELSVTILIPCLNEELGIQSVVTNFRGRFPTSRIIVVDNGSTDLTATRARAAGAEVVVERKRGKACAVQSCLARISSDIVIMVDGDGSYPVEGAQKLIELFMREPFDMINGIRKPMIDGASPFRPLHLAGTSAFARVLELVFDYKSRDLFSGLRLFSRRFYKNVPIHSRGFELEMELTIQAVDKGFTMAEVEVPFKDRAAGSVSKLRTVRDGFRILRLLLVLFRDYRPLIFFSMLSAIFFAFGLLAGSLPIYEYLTTRQVGRFPLAVLAAALCNLAAFTFFTGVLLESNLRHHREEFQLELRKFEQPSA